MEKVIRNLELWNWRCLSVSLVVGAGLLTIYRKSLPPEVPLLYSRPWGQEQLIRSGWLWAVPITGLMLTIILTGWAKKMGGYPVLAIIVLASNLVLQIILTFGLLRVVLLVV